MQLELSAFPKEQKAKYFFDSYIKGLVCTSTMYNASVDEQSNLVLSNEAATAKFDFNEVVGNFLFLLLGFIVIRNTLKYKDKTSTKGKIGGTYV